MSIREQRAVRRGRSAWMRGDLQGALRNLEAVLETAPRALEALYPMARVLAESDQRDRALAVLEQAATLDASGYVGRVFASVLHYDYGEWEEARKGIEGFEHRSVLASSLKTLIDFETGGTTVLALHRGALWIGEMAGRVLAALESRLFARDRAEVNSFHERLFTEGGDAGASTAANEADKSAPDPSTGDAEAVTKDPERFRVNREWWAALEEAFRAGDHPRVTRLYRRKEVPEDWRDVITGVLNGYSLLALGESRRGLEAAQAVARQHPEAAWPHFLAGLAHTSLDDRRHAIYAFVRASQRSDVEMHQVMMELSRTLEVSIELAD